MAKVPPTKKAPVKSAPEKKAAPTKAPPTKAAPAKAAKSAAAAPEKAEAYTLKSLQADVAAKLPLVGRATVDRVVAETFSQVAGAFVSGKAVNIKDFGRIEVKHRPERTGRNPATGASITIPAKTVPKFSFAKALKEAALGG